MLRKIFKTIYNKKIYIDYKYKMLNTLSDIVRKKV